MADVCVEERLSATRGVRRSGPGRLVRVQSSQALDGASPSRGLEGALRRLGLEDGKACAGRLAPGPSTGRLSRSSVLPSPGARSDASEPWENQSVGLESPRPPQGAHRRVVSEPACCWDEAADKPPIWSRRGRFRGPPSIDLLSAAPSDLGDIERPAGGAQGA